jgi:ABC-type transport system substrate-binding protein
MYPAYQLSPSQYIGFNPNITGRQYDPAKAKQLLKDAGYANGFKTRMIATSTDDKDTLVAMQTYLKEVGIDATLDIADAARYNQIRTTGWKNGLMYGGTGADPNQSQRLSGDLGADAPYYASTKRAPDWQMALLQAMAARDLDTRKERMQMLLKIAADDEMVIPLFVGSDIAAIQPGVNVDYLAIHHVQWKPRDAWLSK